MAFLLLLEKSRRSSDYGHQQLDAVGRAVRGVPTFLQGLQTGLTLIDGEIGRGFLSDEKSLAACLSAFKGDAHEKAVRFMCAPSGPAAAKQLKKNDCEGA